MIRRSGELEHMKSKVNTPIKSALRALEQKDYATACHAIDDQEPRKILGSLNRECRIRLRDDGADPYEMLKSIRTAINGRAEEVEREVFVLLGEVEKSINACRLSEAAASIGNAEAQLEGLFQADDNGCRKNVSLLVPELKKLSEALGNAQKKCLGPDVAYFLVSVAGQGFTYKYDRRAKEPVADAKGNVLPDEHGITWVSVGAWVGTQVKGKGQLWLKVKNGEDHDTTKESMRKYLLSRACQKPWLKADRYQSTQTDVSQPTIWQRGPQITTIEGPFESKTDYAGKRKSDWKVTLERKPDGTPIFMSELFRKIERLDDCDGVCCALKCTDEFHCD